MEHKGIMTYATALEIKTPRGCVKSIKQARIVNGEKLTKLNKKVEVIIYTDREASRLLADKNF